MGSKRDQGDGPDRRGEHGQGEEDQDKVIRLPRDWLGPRDELVPFGPSADRDDPEDKESASRPDEAPPPEAVSPDDFWGERSASLQGPLEEADDDSTSEPHRRRAWAVGAAAAAVVAIAVVVLSLMGGPSGPGKVRVDAGANRGGRAPGALPLLPAQTPPASHPAPSTRRRSKTTRNSRSHPAGALAVNYVRESSSSQGATAGGGATAGTSSSGTASSTTNSTSPGTGPSTSTPEENTQPPSNSSSGSRPASKAPAFGAGGALGPGHSPSG